MRPDGPRKIQERHQVTLPADQLAALGLGPGDEVWVSLNPDRPGTLVILSPDVTEEVFRKGWSAI
jgi:bifunctional DNA-binding transcriptional regulator/antitoxin component of YhaV-PrlF toxin-antitoxin module